LVAITADITRKPARGWRKPAIHPDHREQARSYRMGLWL